MTEGLQPLLAQTNRNYGLYAAGAVLGIFVMGIIGGIGQYGLDYPHSINSISESALQGMQYGGFIGGGVIFSASLIVYFNSAKGFKKIPTSTPSNVIPQDNSITHSEVRTVPVLIYGKLSMDFQKETRISTNFTIWQIASPEDQIQARKQLTAHAWLLYTEYNDRDNPTSCNLFTFLNPNDPVICIKNMAYGELGNGVGAIIRNKDGTLSKGHDPDSDYLLSNYNIPVRDYRFKSSIVVHLNALKKQGDCFATPSSHSGLYNIYRNNNGETEVVEDLEKDEARGLLYHLVTRENHTIVKNTGFSVDLAIPNVVML